MTPYGERKRRRRPFTRVDVMMLVIGCVIALLGGFLVATAAM